ncbi:CAP-Gly domain-containing linker protein 2-like protein [Dinothrombium tinctorium]|uniref:CAP-Gly domain-containing linker protein 2-like protein n=1 Tax=Dinothrombium tinctorium TaxID=1965070 RepID=A0A3S3S8I5_9ACAR|nr:CAP-Gly domain-containing linker protein 2-like protein [Dinothrombium tinctorium]RWS10640.1 CAP-Gly domain-containing linker protein 2-like protein [Dinothrombium tinctorium]
MVEEPLRSTVYFRKVFVVRFTLDSIAKRSKKLNFFIDYQSAPLTRDTDDFIVGDRVWVNGVKPGYIQYIGETHFAPGDWAGVVLDEPTGKNDGSVGTKRYFYCEPKRGVFCRLERLTRFPENGKGSPDSGIYRESPSPALNGFSPNRYSSLSRRSKSPSNSLQSETITSRTPDGKYSTTTTFQSREKSPSLHRRETCSSYQTREKSQSFITNDKSPSFQTREKSPTRSLTPTFGKDTQETHYSTYTLPRRPAKTVTTVSQTTTTIDGPYKPGPLRVGDKVFVNSSKGVLAGKLRYLGRTEFAAGYWAGVQLDEPVGKNDGSVAGRRYFHCPSNYGLFAPAYKVVKADPKRMTTITRVTRLPAEKKL